MEPTAFGGGSRANPLYRCRGLNQLGAFEEVEITQLDAWAIVEPCAGVASIESSNRAVSTSWLQDHNYQIVTLDCSGGLDQMIPNLDGPLRWQDEFGYRLEGSNRNLDALNDGFRNLEVPPAGRLVFEILRPEVGWAEDRRWFRGFLEIASRRSRYLLALGRRFFVLLIVESKDSDLVGDQFGSLEVAYPFNRFGWSIE